VAWYIAPLGAWVSYPSGVTGQRVTGAGQAVATDIIEAAAIAYVRAPGTAVGKVAGRGRRRGARAGAVVAELLSDAAVITTAVEFVRVPSIAGDERAVMVRGAELARTWACRPRFVRHDSRRSARIRTTRATKPRATTCTGWS
jgi:hypothetical protein